MTVLESFLLEFEGCVLVVSHDRYFLDKVCQHILAFRPSGEIKDFPGNYTQYRQWEQLQLTVKETLTIQTESAPNPSVRNINEAKEKRKLTYKEKLEFEQLDNEIPLLEANRTEMNRKAAAGEIPGQDTTEFFKKLALLSEDIDTKTMRWLELSEFI
jgi:ATP-binding cassette subfamily F protein uup